MHAYRNEVGQASNWTRVVLRGGGEGAANRSAIGAIDSITVRWPDAADAVQTFTDVRANYPLEIVQGDDAVIYGG